jgi:hypothetical protein
VLIYIIPINRKKARVGKKKRREQRGNVVPP